VERLVVDLFLGCGPHQVGDLPAFGWSDRRRQCLHDAWGVALADFRGCAAIWRLHLFGGELVGLECLGLRLFLFDDEDADGAVSPVGWDGGCGQ
jgi:hypothetical protein